jgi:hypothetical protein
MSAAAWPTLSTKAEVVGLASFVVTRAGTGVLEDRPCNGQLSLQRAGQPNNRDRVPSVSHGVDDGFGIQDLAELQEC